VYDDDDERESPPMVVGAVAAGVAPLPFIGVYAIMFLIHGSIHPINPPDVTTTKGGEFAAGLVALAVFILASAALLMFLNGRRRWPFALTQLAVLGAAIAFFVDETAGGQTVSFLVILTSVAALLLGFSPQGWEQVRRTPPRFIAIAYRRPVPPRVPVPTALEAPAPATVAEPFPGDVPASTV
jgi:hypothetical protein